MIISKLTGVGVVAALLLSAMPADVEAQRHGPRLDAQEPTSPALGARFGYDFNAADLTLGAHARVPAGPVYVVPSGDLFLDGDDRNWQLNADAIVPLRRLYAGGGVGVVSQTRAGQDETQVGFNLLAGIEMARARPGRTRPFAEGRWTFLDDGSRFHLVLGMNVYTGDPPRRTPVRGRR